MATTPVVFPLGARGERPVRFTPTFDEGLIEQALAIPGVVRLPDGVAAPWCAAAAVSRVFGVAPPELPTEQALLARDPAAFARWVESQPGYAEYVRLDYPNRLRVLQKPGVAHLAWRAGATEEDCARSGKTPMSTGAAILVGANPVLVLVPDHLKEQWWEEIHIWTGCEAVLLEGRGAREASWFCGTCVGRGRTADGAHCPACRARNGQSYGYRKVYVPDADKCPDHPGQACAYRHQPCQPCRRALLDGVRRTRFVLANFDIVIAQLDTERGGGEGIRKDLFGWATFMRALLADAAKRGRSCCIIDEIHRLSGHRKRGGLSRAERIQWLTQPATYCWGLSATIVKGFTIDCWRPLTIISGGLFGKTMWAYGRRYADLKDGDWGGINVKGRTPHAETELVERHAVYAIKRPRSVMLADQPPMTHKVVRVKAAGAAKYGRRGDGSLSEGIDRIITKILPIKIPHVVERVMDEAREGNSSLVFVKHRESARTMYDAVGKAMRHKDNVTVLRRNRVKVWCIVGGHEKHARAVQGLADEAARDATVCAVEAAALDNVIAAARAYREHLASGGVGIWVSTIDAAAEGVKLFGATTVHFADLHWIPIMIEQAASRPDGYGAPPIFVYYYVLEDSIDRDIEAVVLDKFLTIQKLDENSRAREIREAFHGPQETVDEIWARHVAHLRGGLDAPIG